MLALDCAPNLVSMTAQAATVSYSATRRVRYVGEPLDMIVDELYRKVACYIVAEQLDEETGARLLHPIGTAFFIRVHLGPACFIYAVTARHVIEGYENAFFRVNTFKRQYRDVPVQYEDWIFHPEADVAICRVRFEPSIDVYPLDYGLGVEVQVGQDVFFIGLFSEFPGTERVEALVRFGKVALSKTVVPMRHPVTGEIQQADAYLVEARSWGGESGAPVFVHDEHYRIDVRDLRGDYPKQVQKSQVSSSDVGPGLLGLLHGHFENHRTVTYMKDSGPTAEVTVPSGIAVVIPASKIFETLNDKRFTQERERIAAMYEEKFRLEHSPKPGSSD